MTIKYDRIGTDYNQTRKADPYLTQRIVNLLKPNKDGLYLDIGCGTGNYTSAVSAKGYSFIGIDPSEKMLAKAKLKSPAIDWRLGSAEMTNLPNDFVDGIMASLTIHHWTNLDKGFQELFRVLKQDGSMLLFTATPQQMKGYWLNHYFPKMLTDSIRQMPSFEEVASAIQKAGFTNFETEKYNIREDLQDLFLYNGKHNPSAYLDKSVRHGISSFSDLANQKEVEKGLKQLKQDIISKEIDSIIKSYENQDGDYLFIKFRKLKSSVV